ncbi:hypothetical protein QE250_16175 [Chromatiaceae bacterium AAb-1]|nr:hypothetical protein [Chromatiaceae bacterium AAb-1]
MRKAIILIVFLCLLGCVSSSKVAQHPVTELKPELGIDKLERRNLMLGKWYGDMPTEEGGRRQWVIHRANDGTYRIDFNIRRADGSEYELTEVGHWGIAGDVYFSIYRGVIENEQFLPSDSSDAYNYNAYQIIKLSHNIFEYQNVDSQNTFFVTKVPDSFVLGQSKL